MTCMPGRGFWVLNWFLNFIPRKQKTKVADFEFFFIMSRKRHSILSRSLGVKSTLKC